jgi:formylmethanofuran dehydrogenase subunit A
VNVNRPSLCLRGGRVIDPVNRVDGVRDVWIQGDRICPEPADASTRALRTIDVRGDIVMAGAIDVHSHIVGPKVNLGRRMRPPTFAADDDPGDPRSSGRVPTLEQTGRLYAAMGYTTVIDAAIAPRMSPLAHLELSRVPIIDAGILALSGNEPEVLTAVADGSGELLRLRIGDLARRSGAWGLKLVNPGGVVRWKAAHGHPTDLDDAVDGFGSLTPRAILESITTAIDALDFPHPAHVHGMRLGLPDSADAMFELMKSIDGRRVHLAHVQFHSYGGAKGGFDGFASHVHSLAEFVNTHANITVDIGQVMFGPTLAMTADSGVGQYLAEVTGRPWSSVDIECECGCAVLPVAYMSRKRAHALQWAIGLEWYLRVADPWRIALTTDHPNGGSFLAYPELIALLMDREYRRDALRAIPADVLAAISLTELDREYSLEEIAILTRGAPARILGMPDRGHLNPGAIADVVVYTNNSDRIRMFSHPRLVVKSGREVSADAPIHQQPLGNTLRLRESEGIDCLGFEPSRTGGERSTERRFEDTSAAGARPSLDPRDFV